MGAKKGGHTTRRLMKRENLKILKEIHQVLKLPMKFLHVIRNPYDNIATMMLRDLKKRPDAGEKVIKLFDRGLLTYLIFNCKVLISSC